MSAEVEAAKAGIDQLYLNAEYRAAGFSLFPEPGKDGGIRGLVSDARIRQQAEQLSAMEVDGYIEATVQPVEEPTRPGARQIIKALGIPLHRTIEQGPLYIVETEMKLAGEMRRVGFVTQDRSHQNGVWMPEHHTEAAQAVIHFASRSIPVVTFLDTPGAAGTSEANAANQAHTISRLIAEMCNLDVPSVGIIIGQAYSGGAIPLAATNVLLALRSGVFSTIRPQGLASIARRYNYTWQECARFVGVATAELYLQGNLDGIIDYDPGETEKIGNLYQAITDSILSVEQKARQAVGDEPDIMAHYQRNIRRYLNPASTYLAVHADSLLKLRTSPTEWPNIFGVTYRYLRYLGLRKRIRSTTTSQYGRLSSQAIPQGQMAARAARDRRAAFLDWLQDPDRILYEDELNKPWKQFVQKRQELGEERSRLSQFIFGEPARNFDDARNNLVHGCALYLFNRFKGDVGDYLDMLIQHLRNRKDTRYLLQPSDIVDLQGLLQAIGRADSAFVQVLRNKMSYQGRKLLDQTFVVQQSSDLIRRQLITELNIVLEGPSLAVRAEQFLLSPGSRELAQRAGGHQCIELNRRLLEEHLWSYVSRHNSDEQRPSDADCTLLDVLLDPEISEPFIAACQSLLVFEALYRDLIQQLVVVARKASEFKALDQEFIGDLVERAVSSVVLESRSLDQRDKADLYERFFAFMGRLTTNHNETVGFLKSVEDWQRAIHPNLSDTLFVIISFVFERLVQQYDQARQGRRYDGRLNPRRIGRRKDFWNRLALAYQDLLIQEVLTQEKRKRNTGVQSFTDEFFRDFEELHEEMMTVDPVQFPSLRNTVEDAMKKGVRPCGVVTGTGNLKISSERRVGVILSNLDFQVGCIDMASCEKICKLLVRCAAERLPVIGFISSGGMQTKEGASVLFSMAVLNDRITRFVRDNDLPIIMFGFGDCTGGSQASFVTHPLVQTYYFSGTNMPFAGQTVVESNLTSQSILSNYLSLVPRAMKGLVRHPFSRELDEALRNIDPAIPLPTESVTGVVERVLQGVLESVPPQYEVRKPDEQDLPGPVKRVLIHARGCTAVRLIRCAQSLKLQVVLVQSDPDMDSVPADMALAAEGGSIVCIGGNTSDESYLNALSVLRVAEAESVDALHPGIGFLSEDPNFARLCRERGINFIGPGVSSMETMGNKSNAINATRSIDVPVVPGSHGIVNTSEAAAEVAEQVGFPVLIKAVHGGGGKGIQLVERADQLHSLFLQVTAEARAAFGNGDIYLEKFVTSLRHVEVQVLRDTHGNTRILGLRDCSVQRNNQKLMEESTSTVLPRELRDQAYDYALRIAEAVDYIGAGTVEFIYDIPSEAIYFMEMNTRLQVEHPVTEKVTGIDIVAAQIAIASGESIADMQVEERGYAMEVRINAEKTVLDAEGKAGFAPAPGRFTDCSFPDYPDMDVISIAATGKSVTPFYDSLVAQVIARGEDRDDVIAKLQAYLSAIRIKGISTNIPLLQRVLRDPVFQGGSYDTGYLPDLLQRLDIHELIAETGEAAGKTDAGLSIDLLRIEGSGELKVVAPSTGVFFVTPSPSDPPFVSVGDVIDRDHTLCQIEAMKVFTSVSLASFVGEDAREAYASDRRYRVKRVNQTNGQQVNEGDLLFVIEPIAD